ncbi:MAG TPA: molybdopterin cofactor-binding domain-containing protein [Steroidobacter sp.]|uniref:xanthine dehydrogenase family protein molybdopterin-binding subunit n=1 Tax=Steroidobacter sp. TaxID=1978227 RepID=UPI002ED93A73
MAISRRKFLIGSGAVVGGGVLVGYVGYSSAESNTHEQAAKLTEHNGARLLAGWVTIAPDDVMTVLVPHADFGQGTHTALAMMLAEELDADWSKVRAIQAPGDDAFANWFLAEAFSLQPGVLLDSGIADPIFKIVARRLGLQITGGSTAVRCTGEFGLRRIGAGARQMLIRAAAKKWSVSADSITTKDSVVIHAASGRTLRYGELVDAASRLSVPSRPPLKPREQHRLMGQSVLRPDIPLKVTGSFSYGIDVRLTELRYAATKAAPVHGGRLIAVDVEPAMNMKGVETVMRLPDSVAVIAREPWQALQAVARLDPRFSAGDASAVSTDSLYADQLIALDRAKREQMLKIGSAKKTLEGAQKRIESTYRAPFLHHAQMEPINATAQWKDGELHVWTGAQDAITTRRFLAETAGVSTDAIHLYTLPLGGSFGRKTGPDADAIYYPQLVAIAKQCAPHPVKLIWSREEDTAQGWYRPQATTRITAALGPDGLPIAWSEVFTEGRPGRSIAYPIPYEIPHQLFEQVRAPHHVRIGPLRSVNSTQHGFFRESFIDELAHAARQDPLHYRLALMKNDARVQRVLKEAAERSDWGQSLPPGRGRGVALHIEYESVIAQVVEASWEPTGVKVHRVVAVVDCGDLVHPDTAAQQVEGATIMGLSNAVAEQINIAEGAVVEKLFSDYRIFTLADTPTIEVHFLGSDAPRGGLGELGVPAAAPALANAIFAATGLRARRTPLNSAIRELQVLTTDALAAL